MQTTTNAGFPFLAAQALANHLRHNPEAANTPPGELAKQFQLEADFVQEILEGLRLSAPKRTIQFKIGLFSKLWDFLEKLFLGMTRRPTLFVTVTTAFIALGGFALLGAESSSASSSARQTSLNFNFSTGSTVVMIVGLLTILLHYAAYFRHGKSRYALYGGLAAWLVLAPVNMVLVFLNRSRISEFRTAITLLIVAFAFFLLCAIYSGIGVLVAVLGGYARMRRLELREVKQSRQELLNRLYRIREKLESSETPLPTSGSVLESPTAERFGQQPALYAGLAGLAIGTLHTLVIGFITLDLSRRASPAVGIAEILFLIVSVLGLIAVGFFSRRPARAAVSCIVFNVASRLPFAIPLGTYGFSYFMREAIDPESLIVSSLLSAAVGIAASIGARVEERASHDQKIRESDPATLLAEMVRIQWRLSVNTSTITVIFVDVARSAEMKASADPLAVEYSFREYQQLVDGICRRFDGTVQFTSGDGAVVSFTEPRSAYDAARKIQSEIETFNRTVNRLDRLFRLRIGIHQGSVTGELNKVEHTEVIDIAAHVQGLAPVGGIALTEPVAKALEGEGLIPLREPVDGQNVFLAMDPTE